MARYLLGSCQVSNEPSLPFLLLIFDLLDIIERKLPQDFLKR